MLTKKRKYTSVFTRNSDSKNTFTIYYNKDLFEKIKKHSNEHLYTDVDGNPSEFLNNFLNLQHEFINDLGFEIYIQLHKYHYKSGDEFNIKVKII